MMLEQDLTGTINDYADIYCEPREIKVHIEINRSAYNDSDDFDTLRYLLDPDSDEYDEEIVVETIIEAATRENKNLLNTVNEFNVNGIDIDLDDEDCIHIQGFIDWE